jgi:hypothetical protein
MTELGGETARITMGEVRLDAGKTRRFTTSVQSIGGLDRLLWPSVRFAVAQDARRRDPGPMTTGNPGNVGEEQFDEVLRTRSEKPVL